jgi:hypothetical protein
VNIQLLFANVRRNINFRILMIVAALAMMSMVSFAQTPVPLEIDTNQLFSQANTWIANFLPIFAITIGITIALSVLGYFSGVFSKVFKGK